MPESDWPTLEIVKDGVLTVDPEYLLSPVLMFEVTPLTILCQSTLVWNGVADTVHSKVTVLPISTL